MPLLKCTKCNKEFKTSFIKSSKAWGISGIWWGWIWTYPIWPWITGLVAECPYCNEKTKLKVINNRKNKIINLIIGFILVVVILIFLWKIINR